MRIREARPQEAQLLADVQEKASIAALGHIFPPERYAKNARARRFYERRGWRENGDSRVVAYPTNPLDVGYSLDF
jgi:hypothetical protein